MTKPSVKIVPASLKNYSSGRAGCSIKRIIIHTQQGTERGTEAWFADPQAHASAHYGIAKDGSISQFVDDKDTAWHAGNALYNRESIGIELEGYMEEGDFPPPMMNSLRQLCLFLGSAYNLDFTNEDVVIGHCDVPDPADPTLRGGAHHHQDPGNFLKMDELRISLISRD